MFNNAKASNKAIKGLIASIARQNNTLRLKIHTALCRISAHAYEHGDVTMFTYLLDNVRRQDRKAKIAWIEESTFGGLDNAIAQLQALAENPKVVPLKAVA